MTPAIRMVPRTGSSSSVPAWVRQRLAVPAPDVGVAGSIGVESTAGPAELDAFAAALTDPPRLVPNDLP